MKKIAVVGAAESGVGAAILAKKKGYDVFVSDFGEIKPEFKDELRQHNIPFEEKGHTIDNLIDAVCVIKSPGVPGTAPVISSLKENGLKVISEIEFGFNNYPGLTVAITGSNGKTTTSGLIYHLLKTAGKDVAIGGNFGVSFCRILAERTPEMMVLEVSSFQLDDVYDFKPDIGVILNISEDHLDRYEYDVWKYAAAKMKLIQNQSAEDHYIFNADDELIIELNKKSVQNQHLHPVSIDEYKDGVWSKDQQPFVLTINGKHNYFNATCAAKVCRILEIDEATIGQGLATFENSEHRLETVAEIDGVTFINDSKATNIDAVYYALEAMTKPVIWVVGGVDKGNDYTVLKPLVEEKVKAIICLGKENSKIVKAFAYKPGILVETTKVSKVVSNAMYLASAGDIVLLSPACASFDLFDNYIDRGNQFKEAVLKLKEEKTT